jgi:hypothetical protein
MLVTPISKTTPDGRDVSLTMGRIYEVLGIEADDYRILTNEDHLYAPNDPVLYEPECFRLVDAREPDFWICELGEDGERYAYPECWSRIGFWEDYHDHVQAVREQFWNDLRILYPKTWAERRGTR